MNTEIFVRSVFLVHLVAVSDSKHCKNETVWQFYGLSNCYFEKCQTILWENAIQKQPNVQFRLVVYITAFVEQKVFVLKSQQEDQ